jgi:hypothetical protein
MYPRAATITGKLKICAVVLLLRSVMEVSL